MPMLKTLPAGTAVLLNETPFLGGHGHEALYHTADGVTLEGADVIDTPVNGDFSPITLTDADIQEITLPRWIRAVGGDAILEGVQ